jgi:hypothetical protein
MPRDTLQDKSPCPYAGICPFFARLEMPASASVLRIRYCLTEYERCERYKLKSSGKAVPEPMWPDGTILKPEPASA